MKPRPVIVWFRLDLRLADNPALHHAADEGGPIIPVFLHDPTDEGPASPGAASRWWLHHSLGALDASLRERGSRLIVRQGSPLENLRTLIHETNAAAVHWNRRYEPSIIERDRRIKEALTNDGLKVASHNAALLHEPWTVKNKSGNPFKVFTPFWRHCTSLAVAKPLPVPNRIMPPAQWPQSANIDDLNLLPQPDWANGFTNHWRPGEAAAQTGCGAFLRDAIKDYPEARDRPDQAGTSRLSPHLHFGEISPRQIWHSFLKNRAGERVTDNRFLAEIGWREFAHHLIYHFPHTTDQPLRPEFAAFPWRKNRAGLRAWQRGATGYPIVDAGMRELWATGWMHNRVRMIVASFLVKDLLIDWREGAAWFWDTLVDADLASNTLGWQWTAGCGADAAPFFRIFNPTAQSEKFDPAGAYVRRWCPELSSLPDRWIHQPWKAPASVREGIRYPEPIVSHAIAREVALEAFQRIKKSGG